MGPAFAGSVVPKAIADSAITEAIAVIEIIFMSRSPWTSMPTLSTWRLTIEKAIIKKVIFAHPPGLTARRLRAVSDFSKRARTATRKDEIVFNGNRHQSVNTRMISMQHTCSNFGGVIHASKPYSSWRRLRDYRCSGLTASIALKDEFSGAIEIVSYL